MGMKKTDKTAMIASAEYEEFHYGVPTVRRVDPETGRPIDANYRIKEWEDDVLDWHRRNKYTLK